MPLFLFLKHHKLSRGGPHSPGSPFFYQSVEEKRSEVALCLQALAEGALAGFKKRDSSEISSENAPQAALEGEFRGILRAEGGKPLN